MEGIRDCISCLFTLIITIVFWTAAIYTFILWHEVTPKHELAIQALNDQVHQLREEISTVRNVILNDMQPEPFIFDLDDIINNTFT